MGAFLAFFALATLAGAWWMLAAARTGGIADGVAHVLASRSETGLVRPVRLGPYVLSARPAGSAADPEVLVLVRDRRTGMTLAASTASLDLATASPEAATASLGAPRR